MTTDRAERFASTPSGPVLRWLLDSDPSTRWQALRDLTDEPADEVGAERARVAIEGAGRPSRWITLRALHVLDWYSARG